jgi:hypothetical protein
MKRIVVIASIFALACSFAYAEDMAFQDSRNKLRQESAKLKGMMAGSADPVLLSSMWDSCLLTTTQIDAYYYMMNIFNTINKRRRKEPAVKTLADWLNAIKNTNELTIRSLADTSQALDNKTKARMDKLRTVYTELNNRVEIEINKVAVVRDSLR